MKTNRTFVTKLFVLNRIIIARARAIDRFSFVLIPRYRCAYGERKPADDAPEEARGRERDERSGRGRGREAEANGQGKTEGLETAAAPKTIQFLPCFRRQK